FTNQFFMEKPQEEEPKKTNVESKVQLMVMVPIHQDTSLVPPMTTPVIDLNVTIRISNCSCSAPNINNNNHNNHNKKTLPPL
nr:hypothetical protein [Tanacetum cinerariifolium]